MGGNKRKDGGNRREAVVRSQEEAKKHKNEGVADQRAKRAALATAFRLHRDGIGKDWSGPKKVEEWLDELGWAALEAVAAPPAAGSASETSQAEKADAERSRKNTRINVSASSCFNCAWLCVWTAVDC